MTFLKTQIQMNPEDGGGVPVVNVLPDINNVMPGASYYKSTTGNTYTANKVTGLWQFSSSLSGGLIFERVMSDTKQIQAGHYYLADNSTERICFQLPATINTPDTFIVAGYGVAGFKIVQGEGQQIDYGTGKTEIGINGYIESYLPDAVVKMTCIEQNKVFKVDALFSYIYTPDL